MNKVIRNFDPSDWPPVSTIYREGLETRNATFETEVPAYDTWIQKFHSHLLWVAEYNGKVVGWAGLQPVSTRKVYQGVAEVTIYVASLHAGKGIGKTLMNHLIAESEKAGIWSLYASIFPENLTSIHVHRSTGFREVGYREKIAQLDGIWRNTILFEKRSAIVGV